MTGRSHRRAAGWGRAVTVAAATVTAALWLTAAGQPASAAPRQVDACTTTSGVILAVDFGHWGGPLLRSCGSTPTTGYQLLNQGGWHTAGDRHDGPAFVCRIGYAGYRGGTRYPTPDQDPCVVTPPASAYWSYWHAEPGRNTWSYSQLGAMSYHPKPGSVDLWTFGATDITGTEGRPAFSPDSVRAHNTTPATGAATPAPARAPAGAPPGRPARGPGTTGPAHTAAHGPPTRPVATAAPSAPAATRTSPAGSAGSGGSGGSTGSAPPTILDAAPIASTAPARPTHGSATPAIIALGIVLVLAAAGITAVLRRPRPER